MSYKLEDQEGYTMIISQWTYCGVGNKTELKYYNQMSYCVVVNQCIRVDMAKDQTQNLAVVTAFFKFRVILPYD
jgi:hypothetical protein